MWTQFDCCKCTSFICFYGCRILFVAIFRSSLWDWRFYFSHRFVFPLLSNMDIVVMPPPRTNTNLCKMDGEGEHSRFGLSRDRNLENVVVISELPRDCGDVWRGRPTSFPSRRPLLIQSPSPLAPPLPFRPPSLSFTTWHGREFSRAMGLRRGRPSRRPSPPISQALIRAPTPPPFRVSQFWWSPTLNIDFCALPAFVKPSVCGPFVCVCVWFLCCRCPHVKCSNLT